MSFLGLLRQAATIERPSLGRSSTGEPEWSFSTVASDVPILVQPDQSGGIEVHDEPTGSVLVGTHYGYLQITADLQVHDRVTVGSEVYRVIRVDDAAGQDHHLEVRLSQPDRRAA